MSALLFITLLVGLTYAAEECKVNEGHCSKCGECTCECCAEGYTKSNTDTVKCSECAFGYVKDGEECKQCDVHCTSACTTSGKGKCDYSCESGFYLVTEEGDKKNTCATCVAHCAAGQCTSDKKCTTCATGFYKKVGEGEAADQCLACQDSKCVACSEEGTGKCTQCKDGYELKEGKCETKYDCKDNNVKNCGECASTAADAECYECKDGYKFDDAQDDDAKRCVEEDKLTKCEWTDEYCGKKEEGKMRYQEDFCYSNDGVNFKIEGGNQCYYADSACKDRLKQPSYLDVTDNCIRLKDKTTSENKYYKMKKPGKCESEQVKEYTKEDCSDEGTNTFTEVCRKVESGEYENNYVMTSKYSPKFAVFTDADCSKELKEKNQKLLSSINYYNNYASQMNAYIRKIPQNLVAILSHKKEKEFFDKKESKKITSSH